MASVIDELIVVLNLDPSKFNAAQKSALAAFKKTQEEAEKTGKNVEAQGKKILNFFSDLKREALTLMAVFLGGRGIKEAVMHITNLDASTERLSRTFGVSTHDLAIWQSILEQVGGSAEDARSVIGGLTSTIATFHQTGVLDQGLLNVWQRLGLSTADREDPIKILKALAAYSQRPGVTGPMFAAFANQVPGMTPKVIDALNQGKLQEYIDAAERAGVGSKESGEHSQAFITSLSLLETASLNVVRVMEEWLIPVIKSLTELFRGWLIEPGSPEAKALDTKFNEDLKKTFSHHGAKTMGNVSNAFASWVDGLVGVPTVPKRSRGDTGIGIFSGATGYSIEEGGLVIDKGTIGAKGAAATSSVVNDRSSRSTSTNSNSVTIDTINMHLPRATDAAGVARGLNDAISNQSFGASANSGAQ